MFSMPDVSVPPFDTAQFLATAGDGRTIAQYRKSQRIFLQGDAADAVFFVQEAKVKVTVLSGLGKEAIVAIINPGEFCGEGCLSRQTRRISSARAMVPSDILRIEKGTLVDTLQNEPLFSAFFLDYMLKRTLRVEEDLVDQLFNSSEKRLARALLLLANFGKDGEPEPILAKISQETLAEMIGTTRARVNFFMNKFRKLGFISYGDSLEVHSSLLG